jgi:hypothetical protein
MTVVASQEESRVGQIDPATVSCKVKFASSCSAQLRLITLQAVWSCTSRHVTIIHHIVHADADGYGYGYAGTARVRHTGNDYGGYGVEGALIRSD